MPPRPPRRGLGRGLDEQPDARAARGLVRPAKEPAAAEPSEAEQALAAIAGMRLVQVQLSVLQAALGQSRMLLAREDEDPVALETARGLAAILGPLLERVPPADPRQRPVRVVPDRPRAGKSDTGGVRPGPGYWARRTGTH